MSCARLPSVCDRLAASLSLPDFMFVFTNQDVFLTITSFQVGLPPHLLPFAQFVVDHWVHLPPQFDSTSPSYLITRADDFLIDQLTAFGTLFDPWVAAHGMDAIPRLVALHKDLRVEVVYFAVLHDDIPLIRSLHRHRMLARLYPDVTFVASWVGSLPVLKYLDSLKEDIVDGIVDFTPRVMDRAARRGHLHIVRWLHAHRLEGCTTQALDGAARYGHLEIVQFLHFHRTEGATTIAMDEAATYGHADIVRFLHTHRSEGCTTIALNYAAARGWLEIVQFLHAHRSEGCTTMAMDSAACNGHLEIVKFLHFHRTEGATTRAIDGAARHKHWHVVEFLLTHRTEGYSEPNFDMLMYPKRLGTDGGHLLHHHDPNSRMMPRIVVDRSLSPGAAIAQLIGASTSSFLTHTFSSGDAMAHLVGSHATSTKSIQESDPSMMTKTERRRQKRRTRAALKAVTDTSSTTAATQVA
ncbi:Aste57867_10764 [Aphanomyces stellatus]|uniref:Aste57867_10764 protein n=1 Tax=Aphanomyces stellatus TaxID=120398 RepID=A0A485KR76_9STRA|nr:hypothetical protein As57867_010724 [Aphanomyces stellatus]VFT87634.1 Aste57867_10764 [Aphanomyces stellatus]